VLFSPPCYPHFQDDAKWESLGIKQGQVLMLMGSAEAVPEAPVEKIVFVEDMPAADVAALSASKNPGGLTNLGNTCYLNSTLQVMMKIPELSQALQKYAGAGGESDKALLFAMRELMGELERSTAAQEVRPFKFVSVFRQNFPMFAQQAEGGRGFMQQDAEECWSTIVTALAQRLKVSPGPEPSDLMTPTPVLLPRMDALRDNLGDALFGVEMKVRYKCLESDAEPEYEVREAVRKISCHISEKTAHLYTAVESSLTETIEKNSPALGREASFQKTAELARLPPYLAVNFVRFAWRKDTAKRAKILRPISFPDVLDVRNLCTKELKANIASHNNRLEEAKERAAAEKAALAVKAAEEAKDKDESEEIHRLAGAAALSSAKTSAPAPPPIPTRSIIWHLESAPWLVCGACSNLKMPKAHVLSCPGCMPMGAPRNARQRALCPSFRPAPPWSREICSIISTSPPFSGAFLTPSAPMETDDAETSEAEKNKAIEEIHAEAARIGPVHALECDNKTGLYELFGIITHQGRTAEGGHYVAWVKRDAKTWLVFDDETVAEIDAARIKELYGGGDWHIAYVCLYRKMDTLALE